MDIYYHIVSLEKRKKCKFDFSYIRSEKSSISGSATVDFSTDKTNAIFDAESNIALDEDEKDYVISRVIRHINIDC